MSRRNDNTGTLLAVAAIGWLLLRQPQAPATQAPPPVPPPRTEPTSQGSANNAGEVFGAVAGIVEAGLGFAQNFIG